MATNGLGLALWLLAILLVLVALFPGIALYLFLSRRRCLFVGASLAAVHVVAWAGVAVTVLVSG